MGICEGLENTYNTNTRNSRLSEKYNDNAAFYFQYK